MNDLEKQIIYSAILRLANEDEILSPAERRDVISELCRGLCDMSLDEILNKTRNNRKLRLKRGDTATNDAYTGLAGEITMDTDTGIIRVHDGETVGGVAMARAMDIAGDWVVESQLPTAENNYTWYRKYKSGWVEMGGTINTVPATEESTIYFIIPFKDDTYYANRTLNYYVGSNDWVVYCGSAVYNKTKTSMSFRHKGVVSWYACGVSE